MTTVTHHATFGFPQAVEALDRLGFSVRRSWPRSADHLLLELHARELHGAGAADAGPSGPGADDAAADRRRPETGWMAGQWFGSLDQARLVAVATPGSIGRGQVVLQPGGADRVLKSLPRLAADPTALLVSHRPERRAVLRVRSGPETIYTKVVARNKAAGLERVSRRAAGLGLRTPAVSDVDAARGIVTTSALPGVPLHELLGGPRAAAACEATGAALAALHRLPVPADLPLHTESAEMAVAAAWRSHADALNAPLAFADRSAGGDLAQVCATPTGQVGRAAVLVHRDFHDKQVIVDEDNSVGILDFDLMAMGEPALDLANLLVHLELRQRQGIVADSRHLEEATLAGYRPSRQVLSRLPRYRSLAWFRLAAVYAFRPGREPT
ncbi:MAG TPA: phosphotransferase [Propionibacteriaceae bacterium]|nr:phosphotransferase [Propionibacteriaceae bacterium]